MVFPINPTVSWIKDLEHILMYGNQVSPRGMPVYESLAYRSDINMQHPIIMCDDRKLGYKFMAAEAAWILSGRSDVATIAPYAKEISKFSDDGEVFFGAYGPKIDDQLPYVVSALHQDPSSRQAVINIWRESPGPSKDIPCTLSLQFLVRHGSIYCVASMRSSDLWLGHPYDIFNFSAVTFAVMLELNRMRAENGDDPLILGQLMLTAGSKHIYDRNRDDAMMIIDNFHKNGQRSVMKNTFDASRYVDKDDFVMHLWECADSQHGALSLLEG